MTGLTYDTGALIAAERGDERMWALHKRALQRGITPMVPATVLAESWRGQALLARLVSGTEIEPLEEARAKVAGLILARCAHEVGGVDATVVEAALRRRETVVTSNRGDLELLADAVGRRLSVIDI